MIHVDRSLRTPAVLAEKGSLLDESWKSLGPQSKFTFERVWEDPSVIRALAQVFYRRCAFCETHIEKLRGQHVAHFRPLERAQGLRGGIAPRHYGWLAYEWSNLYLVCVDCQRHKGRQFPVKGERLPAGALPSTTPEENLLLDPCGKRNPELSLAFHSDGSVTALDERGKITIRALGLQRPQLIKDRAQWWDSAARTAAALVPNDELPKWKEEDFLKFALDEYSEKPYQATIKTAFVNHYGEMTGRVRPAAPTSAKDRSAKSVGGQPTVSALWVDRIEIKNFRCIEYADIAFPSRNETKGSLREPWLMLLGENGVGKSSLLQAVALTMAPASERRRLVADAAACVTRKRGVKDGFVRVIFSDGTHATLTFKRGQPNFERDGRVPDLPVLGYGSTRIVPREVRLPKPARVSVRNLFDPFNSLADVEPWLASPKQVNSKHFNLIATSLKLLLSLEDADDVIRRREGRLTVRVGGRTVGLRELSDGYQSVFALATDIAWHLAPESPDLESIEGLVLLDEIEVHLHPRWKLRIVKMLREVVPRIRFLATTHDPLCLQGLDDGEVLRLSHDADTHTVFVDPLAVPKGIRADQLLIGEWFGLASTRDPETIGMMDEYGKLLLVKRPTADVRTRLKDLRQTLRRRLGEFDETPLERAALEAAAEVEPELAAKVDHRDARQALREKIRTRLQEKKEGR